VTLELAFRAQTEDDARAQAVAWGAAEPNVAVLAIDAIWRGEGTMYFVTVTITLREQAQGRLGL